MQRLNANSVPSHHRIGIPARHTLIHPKTDMVQKRSPFFPVDPQPAYSDGLELALTLLLPRHLFVHYKMPLHIAAWSAAHLQMLHQLCWGDRQVRGKSF